MQDDQSAFLRPEQNSGANFRFHAVRVFLTYAQSGDVTPQEVFDQINPRYPFKEYIIVQEHHQDGNLHIHACIRFKREVNTTDARCFDLYIGETRLHPHIGRVASWKHAVQYCRKEADASILTNIPESVAGVRASVHDVYREALDSGSRETAYEIIRTGPTRDWVLYGPQIRSAIDAHFTPPAQDYVPTFDASSFTNVPGDALEWALDNISRPRRQNHRAKSLLLVGPSRIGKTEWARSLGPHIYINGYYCLEELEKNGDYLVCDDIPWERFPVWKSILGCQREFTMTDKYRKKIVIRDWNKPCIVLWNPDMYPTEAFQSRDVADWIDANTVKVICSRDPFY